MPKVENIVTSKYQKVALEIAGRIADGKYQVGEKLKSRSTIASNFGVSPETARKAINVLVDLGILEVRQGSGSKIISKEKAEEFITQFDSENNIKTLSKDIIATINYQKKAMDSMKQMIHAFMNQASLAKKHYPFRPYELTVTGTSKLGQSLADLNLWHQTGATIIAIQHEENLILSPGPYETIQAEDILYVVGDDQVLARVDAFFNQD
ncbi:GntR family transcriptional regulator [Streptococcus entericus]|uniref:GntR family transcriptional regulator n=1 Tax=Streptococcus entericus TaxID=155680 RepID=UPI0003722FD3|nr:GntR family transcriptional regulator [Streptococcus entericus]